MTSMRIGGRRIDGRWIVAFVVATLAATALATVTTSRPAAACSCLSHTDAEAMAVADAVFSGTVTSVRLVGPSDGGPGSARLFTVAVDDTFKGSPATDQVVRTAVHPATCGVTVRTDDPVLVFATTGAEGMSTGLCSGTRVLDGPVPDLPGGSTTTDIECGNALGVVRELPPGYRRVAGVVALPLARTHVVPEIGTPPYLAPVGLAVRAGRTAVLTVAPRHQRVATIQWGGSPASTSLRASDCVTIGGDPWLLFDGGIAVDRPRCVALDVTGERTVRVRVSVGKRCR